MDREQQEAQCPLPKCGLSGPHPGAKLMIEACQQAPGDRASTYGVQLGSARMSYMGLYHI